MNNIRGLCDLLDCEWGNNLLGRYRAPQAVFLCPYSVYQKARFFLPRIFLSPSEMTRLLLFSQQHGDCRGQPFCCNL